MATATCDVKFCKNATNASINNDAAWVAADWETALTEDKGFLQALYSLSATSVSFDRDSSA